LQNERVNNALIVAADAIEGATPHIFGNGGGAPPNFAREGTIAQQALELMRERGTPMSTEEIATALGKGKESLYNSLNNNANDKKKAKRLIESAGPGLWKPAGGF
jgi:hypothetical protein